MRCGAGDSSCGAASPALVLAPSAGASCTGSSGGGAPRPVHPCMLGRTPWKESLGTPLPKVRCRRPFRSGDKVSTPRLGARPRFEEEASAAEAEMTGGGGGAEPPHGIGGGNVDTTKGPGPAGSSRAATYTANSADAFCAWQASSPLACNSRRLPGAASSTLPGQPESPTPASSTPSQTPLLLLLLLWLLTLRLLLLLLLPLLHLLPARPLRGSPCSSVTTASSTVAAGLRSAEDESSESELEGGGGDSGCGWLMTPTPRAGTEATFVVVISILASSSGGGAPTPEQPCNDGRIPMNVSFGTDFLVPKFLRNAGC